MIALTWPRPEKMTVAIVACGVDCAEIANAIERQDPRFLSRTAVCGSWSWKKTWWRKG